MLNQVNIVGNVGKEIELRYTASGTAVANMSVACNSKEKVSGEWKDVVYWASVVIWGKQAEACSQYLSKGSPVFVSGKLQERSWESDGQTRRKTEIVANTVKFLGKKDDAQGGGSGEVSDIQPF